MQTPTPHLAYCFVKVMTKNSNFQVKFQLKLSICSDMHWLVLSLISSIPAIRKMRNVSFEWDLKVNLFQPTRRWLLIWQGKTTSKHRLPCTNSIISTKSERKKIQSLHLEPPKTSQKIGSTFSLRKLQSWLPKSLHLGALRNLQIIHIGQRRLEASHSGVKGMRVCRGHITGCGERFHGIRLLRRGASHDLQREQSK